MRIFADKKTIKQILNSKTEAHSYPLWTVGERANITRETFSIVGPRPEYPQTTVDKRWPQLLKSLLVYLFT